MRKKVHHLLHKPSCVPVAGDIGRQAREAESTINVSSRRLRSRGLNILGGGYTATLSISQWSNDSNEEDYDIKMKSLSTTPLKRKTKVCQDLLDVLMVA